MTDTYNDTTGSRKKFLIPLVVLLLCAVSLTGAGYAYNSTVTVNDNTTGDESFVLEVNDKNGALLTEPLNLVAMDLYTETIINKDPTVDKVTVKAAPISNLYKGSIVISDSDAVDGSKTMAVTATATPASGAINYDEVTDATSGSISYAISVELYTAYTDEDDNTPYTGSVTFTSHVATLYYVIIVTITGDGIVFNDYSDATDAVDAVEAALENETFVLAFSATA